MARKNKIGLREVVMAVLVGLIILSLCKIGIILHGYYDGTKQYEELEKISKQEAGTMEQIDFSALQEKNPDIKAWIKVKDTAINYPVVQGKDNDKYLNVTALGQANSKGAIFIDYRCKKPFEDFNTIIYGHRMKDGSMFESLKDYENADFLKAHRFINIATPTKNYEAEVFAMCQVEADSKLYGGGFDGREGREEFLEEVFEKNIIKSKVKVSAGDRLVMLSTCSYEIDDGRLVVFGKLKDKKVN